MMKKLLLILLFCISINTAHTMLIIDDTTLQKELAKITLEAEELKKNSDIKKLLISGTFSQFFEFWIKDILNTHSKKQAQTEDSNKTHKYRLEIDLANEKIAGYTQRKKINGLITDTIVISLGALRKLTLKELFLLLAHEIGHLALHHVSDTTIAHEHDSQQQELEADAFAAKLFPDKKTLTSFYEKMIADHLPTKHERDVYDLFAVLSLGTHPHHRQRYQAMKKIMNESIVHGKSSTRITEIE